LQFSKDLTGAVEVAHKFYGVLFRLRLGNNIFYFACHPELAEEMLIRQKDIFKPDKGHGLPLYVCPLQCK
jgi:hypothetical protein